MTTTEQESGENIIFSDYYIVKNQIWTSWFNFIPRYTNLIKYSMQGIEIQESIKYQEAIEFMIQTYFNVGQARYEKYVKDVNRTKELKEMFNKILDKNAVPTLQNMRFFQQITDDFLRESGMANIDVEKRDPGQAMKW